MQRIQHFISYIYKGIASKCILSTKEYDQDMSQPQTADRPMVS